MSDIVEHLKECAKYADEYPSDVYAFKAAADEITRLREENARLREALKPFADIALYFDAGGIPSNRKVAYVQLRLLRAAAAAIREGEKDG